MTATSQPSSVRAWIAAVRPKTLSASLAPVAVGTAIASSDGKFHMGAATACVIGALGIQIACNFANDYFDARHGTDTHERLGPPRAVASGWLTGRAMLRATIAVVVVVVLPCVAYLVLRAGWPMAVLGAVSVALAFAYTGGSWSLASLGLGDLFAFLFFGPVAVAGTYGAQALEWSWVPVFAGLGIGCLSCALIGVNNLRDLPTDRIAHRHTLAVRLGPRWGRFEYSLCVAGALVVAVGCAWWSGHWYSATAALAAVALAPSVLRVIRGAEGRALNRELFNCARALMAYGALFAIGWIL